jgi:hypothetical protein
MSGRRRGVARRLRCHPHGLRGVSSRWLCSLCCLHRDQTLDSTNCTPRSRCSRNQSVRGLENCSDGGCPAAASATTSPSVTRLRSVQIPRLNPRPLRANEQLRQARERFSNRASASVAKTTCTIQTNKRRIAVMVAPHLSGLLVLQSDFGPRPVLSCRHDVSDFSPKSGLWRGSQHQTAAAVPRLH